MSSNIETAKLVLKSCDCSSSNTNYTSFTWNNINLRTVLGNMYDEYDKFNLSLNSMACDFIFIDSGLNNDLPGYDEFEQNLIINLSGLPFINQTYDVKNKTNTNKVVLGSFIFNGIPNNEQYTTSNNFTFSKNQELASITVYYSKLNGTSIQAGGNSYPQVMFTFDILGVPQIKHDLTKNRMFK